MSKPGISLGIPGDGRCLFRSVVHGACLRAGKPSPTKNLEMELADELRNKVTDELVRRRADTEWFLEGDFDTYVSDMQQSHVWGGEPELLMSSHVLQVPITVYMWDNKSSSPKIIAEYGQEYGKENPICVLYHGSGHYDAMRSPSTGSHLKLKFHENGYSSVPEIVFWNLRDSKATPVPNHQKGVALVSGFSKNILKVFLEEGGIVSPEKTMEKAISGKEYNKLVIVD